MLFRKMIRDVSLYKSQFIAIFMMIFLGVFIFAGVNSEWNGMQIYSKQFYDESNTADAWVYGTNFTQQDIEKLEAQSIIKKVERRTVLDTIVTNQTKKKISLFLNDETTLSQPKVMKGAAYSNQSDGVWLDLNYAQENQLKVGDTLSLTVNDMTIEKVIQGLILHPEMVYQNADGNILPDYKNHGFAVVSMRFIPQKEFIPRTQLLLETKQPQKMEKLVSDTLQKSNLTVVSRKDLPAFQMLDDEITQHQAFGQVFPIVFLLIAVLTTLTTVSKMIINQRTQIGILKALGFKNRKIIFHYLSHVSIVSLIGGLLGYFVGPMIVPSIIYPMMKAVYKLPKLEALPLDGSLWMVFASVSICIIAATIICIKQLKEKPAAAIRPAINMKTKQMNLRHLERFSFYTQWNIRDVMRNKLRSLITVIGVAGCMGLLICAFGMQDSMNHMVNMMFEELQTFEMRAQVDDRADIQAIKSIMKGSAIQEGAIELKSQNNRKTGSLSVLEDTRYLKLQDTNLNNIDLPKHGIALSYNIAESFNLKQGDQIMWRIIGFKTWQKSPIKAIIHTPSAQGITMSKQTFVNSGHSFQPTAIVGLDALVKDMKGVKNIQYLKEDIAKSMDQMLECMNLMIAILIIGAVVLGIVVLYNIGTFSYMEKIREMATLKVLGFHNVQVKKLLRQQNFWLTIKGIIVGIPFGYALIYTVVSTVGDSMDMMIMIQWNTYIGCSLATLLVSVIIMRAVSSKVKQIDMVSALKAME